MPHPDYIVAPEARDDLPMLEPVYPLTAGLSGKVLLKAAKQAVERRAGAARVAGGGVAEGARLAGYARRRSRACTGRRRLPTCRRARRPGSGSPTTSCSPGSWRWPWCGRASRQQPGRSGGGRRQHPRQDRRCAAVRADQLAAPGPEGDRPGHLGAASHAAAAAGRRRLRQDRGGADGDGDRGGGGRAGRADGADRGAGAPARGDDCAARRHARGLRSDC